MTQIATVTALPAPDTAELTVERETACGHSCDGCGRCAGRTAELTIWASAGIPLEIGDRVEVQSEGRVLSIAALVYLGPVALFLVGYLAPVGVGEGWRCLWGGAGFALGLGLAVACDRAVARRQTVRHRVVRKL